MANKDAAFGLKAIGKVGQNRDNQGLSEYSIAASASAIYQNDPVEMLDTGTIGVAAAGDVLLGSLNGVFYTDASTSKPTWANHLEASNAATDIVGFVADDPYERFEVQSAGTVAQTNIGNCADIVYAIGSSPNYVSKVEISGTMAATAAQLKIVGVSKDPDNSELGAANANVIVTINEHFLKQTAGI
jgi:hypothetical protein